MFFKRKAPRVVMARTYDGPTPLKPKSYRTKDGRGFTSAYDINFAAVETNAAQLGRNERTGGITVPNMSTADDAETNVVEGVVEALKSIESRIIALESRRAKSAGSKSRSDENVSDDALNAPDGKLATALPGTDPRDVDLDQSAGVSQTGGRNTVGDAARNYFRPATASRARDGLNLAPSAIRPLTKATVRAIEADAAQRSARNAEYDANARMAESYASAFRK